MIKKSIITSDNDSDLFIITRFPHLSDSSTLVQFLSKCVPQMNNQPKTYETPQTITKDSIAQRAILNVLLEPVLKTRPKKSRQLTLMKPKAAVAIMVVAQYICTKLVVGKETKFSSNREPNLACHCLLIARCY